MNKNQKRIVMAAIAIAALFTLNPPIETYTGFSTGHSFLFDIPSGFRINLPNLFGYFILIFLVAGGLFLWFAGKEKSGADKVIVTKAKVLKPEGARSQLKEIIASYWKGKEPLWKAYWLVGCIGSGVLFILYLLIAESSLIKVLPLIMIITGIPYFIWSFGSIWRCAENAEIPFWKYAARIMILLSSFSLAKGLFFLQ